MIRLSEIAPLVIFFIVLLINTYFSVRFFRKIMPQTRSQIAVDATLFMLYLALGFSLDYPLWFPFVAMILFAVAVLKYALALGQGADDSILKRKIIVDACGTIWCALGVLGFIYFWYAPWIVWIWTGVFVVANIYVLLINPLYRVPKS